MSPTMLCGRPLTYGDAEQIKALKILRRATEKEEERERLREAGELKIFSVTVEATGSYSFDMEGLDEEDAKNQALKEAEIALFVFGFEVYNVKEKLNKGGNR